MHQVNTRGTYVCSRACLPHLVKSDNPHILTLSPPLNLNPRWFKDHLAYTLAKYGMSMCTLGLAAEFASQGVAVNSLWPRTTIATAANGPRTHHRLKRRSKPPRTRIANEIPPTRL